MDEKFELIMEFDEIATSDGITPIHFYVYKYNGKLQGILKTSEEIEKFLSENCVNGDLLITMGAGNVVEIGESLLKK